MTHLLYLLSNTAGRLGIPSARRGLYLEASLWQGTPASIHGELIVAVTRVIGSAAMNYIRPQPGILRVQEPRRRSDARCKYPAVCCFTV